MVLLIDSRFMVFQDVIFIVLYRCTSVAWMHNFHDVGALHLYYLLNLPPILPSQVHKLLRLTPVRYCIFLEMYVLQIQILFDFIL